MSSSQPPGDPSQSAGSDSTASGLTLYQEVQASDEFQDLRKRFRGFVFPATAFFVVWYFLYVFMAAFAPEFMSTRVVGTINIGLIFGLLQFVTTFGITILYVRWANRVLDPRAEAIRARVEGDAQ